MMKGKRLKDVSIVGIRKGKRVTARIYDIGQKCLVCDKPILVASNVNTESIAGRKYCSNACKSTGKRLRLITMFANTKKV